jgi:hypothetical protein
MLTWRVAMVGGVIALIVIGLGQDWLILADQIPDDNTGHAVPFAGMPATSTITAGSSTIYSSITGQELFAPPFFKPARWQI